MPVSLEQWRVATGLVNARYAPCQARLAASPRKYLSRGTLFLRACVAVLQALLILALDTDWWGPWVGSVRGHSVREPVEVVVVHLHVSGAEGQLSVRFYVPALRILLIIAGDVEENPGPPKLEGGFRPTLPQLLKEFGSYPDWDFLGLFLGIDKNTIRSIKSTEREVKRQCWELFSLWLQKTPTASWEDLCKALEEAGDKTQAHSLREKYCYLVRQQKKEDRTSQEEQAKLQRAGAVAASNTNITSIVESSSLEKQLTGTHNVLALPPMDEYASHLKSVYTSNKLPNCPKWPPTSSKKYVHLAIFKKRKVTKQKSDEFTRTTVHGNIDDVLHKEDLVDFSGVGNEQDAKFILLEGAPGIGKTTFAWKLCRKWAKGKILKEYKLVVLLRLQEKRIQEASVIFDLIYHSNSDLRKAVSDEIQQSKGQSLFLVFEGYDELPRKLQTEQSIFLDILCKNFLPEATVLVTSRPSATEFLYWKFRKQISQHIQILGFTKKDIHTYIQCVFCNPQALEEFTQYLKCYPYIRGMMYMPLNAVIVAEIYKDSRESPNKFIPTTMTELYTALTKNLLLRYLFSNNEYANRRWRLRSFSDLPQEAFEQFCKICTIAFNGVIKDEVIFDDLPENFNTLDLMQSSLEFHAREGPAVSYSFFHSTLQEYLAAVHISYQRPEEQIKFFRRSFPAHLANTLRFAAGLTKFGKQPLEFLKPILVEGNSQISLNALHWLFEAQYTDTYSREFSGIDKVEHNYIRDMTPFDYFVLGHAVSCINYEWTITLNAHPISKENLEMLVAGMHYNKTHQFHFSVTLNFTNCAITPESLHYLTAMPEHVAASVVELNLGYNPIGGGAAYFFSKLPAPKSLKILELCDTKMTSEDTKALAELLSQLESQQLEVLNLDNNSLSSEGTGWILGALPHNSILKELGMDHACVCMENVSSLTGALRGSCGLKILRVNDCKIDSDTACEIAGALRENSTVEELYISGNPVGSRGAAAFADMLRENQTLQELDLNEDSIGENGTCMLAESLRCNTTLNILWIPGKYEISISPQIYSEIQNRVIAVL